MLKDFLWTRASLKHTSANIQWYMVCSPKMGGAGGGLGFKPLKEWNKAAMPRHLWALSKKSLFEESNFLSEHSSVVYSVKTAWK